MPNYITNILICDKSDLFEQIVNSEGDIDFNMVVPMPDYIRNTVCGAYDIYSFKTAWRSPHEFLKALSLQNRTQEFHLYWKDEGEDGGLNHVIYLNGESKND